MTGGHYNCAMLHLPVSLCACIRVCADVEVCVCMVGYVALIWCDYIVFMRRDLRAPLSSYSYDVYFPVGLSVQVKEQFSGWPHRD